MKFERPQAAGRDLKPRPIDGVVSAAMTETPPLDGAALTALDQETTMCDAFYIAENPGFIVELGVRIEQIREAVFNQLHLSPESEVIKLERGSIRFAPITVFAERALKPNPMGWANAAPSFAALVLEYDRRMLRIMEFSTEF